jgi:hypothetical protein
MSIGESKWKQITKMFLISWLAVNYRIAASSGFDSLYLSLCSFHCLPFLKVFIRCFELVKEAKECFSSLK